MLLTGITLKMFNYQSYEIPLKHNSFYEKMQEYECEP